MESQAASHLSLIFLGKTSAEVLKGVGKSPKTPNEVPRRQDRDLSGFDRGFALFLLSGLGRPGAEDSHPVGVPGVAGSEPRPGSDDLCAPGNPLDVVPAAVGPRSHFSGFSGDGHRLCREQSARKGGRSPEAGDPGSLGKASLLSVARLGGPREGLRRRLGDLLPSAGALARAVPSGIARFDRDSSSGGAGGARARDDLRRVSTRGHRAVLRKNLAAASRADPASSGGV